MKHTFKKMIACLLSLWMVTVCILPPVSPVFAHQDPSETDKGRQNVAAGIVPDTDSTWNDPEGYWNPKFLTDGYKAGYYPAEPLGWRSAKWDSRDVSIHVSLDLGAAYAMDTVYLYPRGGGSCFPDDYSVEVSDNSVEWRTVASVTGDTAMNHNKRTLTFEETRARYVRLTVTKLSEDMDGHDRVCEISEIEVWGRMENITVLNKEEMWMQVGNTEQLKATVSGTPVTNGLTFVSSAPDVVSVSSSGVVTALAIGEATITCTDSANNSTATCSVRVMEAAEENIRITVPVWGNATALTEEQFRWLREADIDSAMMVGNDNNLSNLSKMLTIARNIWDDDAERNLTVFIHSYHHNITPEASDEEVKAYAEAFRYTPALAGYHVQDEPFDFVSYARLSRIILENDPLSISDVNFLPGVAYSSTEEYYGRLTDYARLSGDDDRRVLSFDRYPFTPTPDTVDETALFGDLETVRRAGLATDVDTCFYVQGVGSSHYGYRRPDEGTLRYHIAAGLSYGFTWFKYYSWFVPGVSATEEGALYTSAIMDHNGQKTELYDVAATLNREVHNVGDVLVHLDSVEVYHTNQGPNGVYTRLPADYFVQSAGGGDAIVSLLKNAETGEYYLMLVNKDFVNERTLQFTLDGVTSLVELDKSVDEGTITPDYENGILTRTFKPGEFALYRLSDGVYGTVPESSANLLADAQSSADVSVGADGWFISNVSDGVRTSTDKLKGWKGDTPLGVSSTLTFDLGESRDMNRLDMYPIGIGAACGNLYPTAVRVHASNDGTTWKTVYTNESIPAVTTTVPVIRFDNVSARYIRLEFPAGGSVALAEVELYDDRDGSVPLPPQTSYEAPRVEEGVNIAAGKPATSSSAYNDGSFWNTQYITDTHKAESYPTDKTLGWHSAYVDARDSEEWVIIDLEARYPVHQVDVYPRGNNGLCFPEDYTIQLSVDGVTWTDVAQVTGDNEEGEGVRSFTFETTMAKYVRMLITRHSADQDGPGYGSSVSEIEVFCGELPETEPETQPETEPETQPETELEPQPETEPETALVTEPTSETATGDIFDDGQPKDDGGCFSALGGATATAALVGMAGAAGAVLRRRREE